MTPSVRRLLHLAFLLGLIVCVQAGGSPGNATNANGDARRRSRPQCKHNLLASHINALLSEREAVPRSVHLKANSFFANRSSAAAAAPAEDRSAHARRRTERGSPATAAASDGFEGLRIAVEYQLDDMPDGPAKNLIVGELVPRAIAVLNNVLRAANPIADKLYLPRPCADVVPGTDDCRRIVVADRCFFATHNPDYFASAQLCDETGCYSTPAGNGVQGADFLLYVTNKPLLNGLDYCGENVLALGAPCEFDIDTGRPLAGVANFCEAGLSTEPQELGAQLDVAVHEIIHALGFSGPLMPRFKGPVGQELGPGGPLAQIDGRTWVVTPTVQQVVREHTGCSTVPGGALESDGGVGTAESHWEYLYYDNELMLGAGEGIRSLLSPLTLALLQDSGWYVAFLERGSKMQYGLGEGCAVAEAQCGEAADRAVLQRFGYACETGGGAPRQVCSYDHLTWGDCRDMSLEPGCTGVVAADFGECQNAARALPGHAANGLHYGAFSRCLPVESGTVHHESSDVAFNRFAGCFKTTCGADGSLRVSMLGVEFACPAGRTVDLSTVKAGLSGVVGPCPDPATICPALQCPSDCSGRGQCVVGGPGEPATCQCYPGWTGPDCSSALPGRTWLSSASRLHLDKSNPLLNSDVVAMRPSGDNFVQTSVGIGVITGGAVVVALALLGTAVMVYRRAYVKEIAEAHVARSMLGSVPLASVATRRAQSDMPNGARDDNSFFSSLAGGKRPKAVRGIPVSTPGMYFAAPGEHPRESTTSVLSEQKQGAQHSRKQGRSLDRRYTPPRTSVDAKRIGLVPRPERPRASLRTSKERRPSSRSAKGDRTPPRRASGGSPATNQRRSDAAGLTTPPLGRINEVAESSVAGSRHGSARKHATPVRPVDSNLTKPALGESIGVAGTLAHWAGAAEGSRPSQSSQTSSINFSKS